MIRDRNRTVLVVPGWTWATLEGYCLEESFLDELKRWFQSHRETLDAFEMVSRGYIPKYLTSRVPCSAFRVVSVSFEIKSFISTCTYVTRIDSLDRTLTAGLHSWSSMGLMLSHFSIPYLRLEAPSVLFKNKQAFIWYLHAIRI